MAGRLKEFHTKPGHLNSCFAESEMRNHTVFNACFDGVLPYTTDGRILAANPAVQLI